MSLGIALALTVTDMHDETANYNIFNKNYRNYEGQIIFLIYS